MGHSPIDRVSVNSATVLVGPVFSNGTFTLNGGATFAKEDGAVTIESDTYITGHASFLGECDFGGEADGYISFISEMTVGPTEDSPLFTVNGYDGTILEKGTLQITATTNVQKLVSRITCRLSSSLLCSLAPAPV